MPGAAPGSNLSRMILTVFRSRLRPDAGDGYAEMADATEAAARAMPGFVSFESYAAPDGARVSIVEFATLEDQRAWAAHALHREAQAAGRDRWYETYDVAVCEVLRRATFETPQASRTSA